MVHQIWLQLFLANDTHPYLEIEMNGTFRDDNGKKSGVVRGEKAVLILTEVVHATFSDRMHFTAYAADTRHRIEFAFESLPDEDDPFSSKKTPTTWEGTFKGPAVIGSGRVQACVSPIPAKLVKEGPKAKQENVRFQTSYVRHPAAEQASL
jgi:hypothetical protein